MKITIEKSTVLKAFILGLFSLFLTLGVNVNVLAQQGNHNHGHSHGSHNHSKAHSAAQATHATSADSDHGHSKKWDVKEMIFHHIADANEADFLLWKIPLPVMIYNQDKGNWFFGLSSQFKADHGEGTVETAGYKMSHSRVVPVDGSKFIDLSITKNVFWMLVGALLLIWIFTSVARTYRRREDQAPTGFQNFIEVIMNFIKDDIAVPNIGEKKAYKYLPYLATLFFFILFMNLFGLIPFIGNPNVTGNIAVTLVLAVLTYIIVTVSGTKDYWGHIFNMPGVPLALKPVMAILEFIGTLTKPISLMIRLFANITAGHVIILALISLIFVFGSVNGVPGKSLGGGIAGIGVAVPFVAFMNLIELLVAFLQAYIFTMLASLYIGEAVAEHEHH